MKSKNITYLPAIDHIRGFAALLILFYHGATLLSYDEIHRAPFTFDHWLQAGSWFSALLVEGHTAVALFMVLSGFIFTIGAYGTEVNYREFIRNRLLRTYPLFMVLLIVGIYAFPGSFNLPAFLQTVFFLGNATHSIQAGTFSSMFWAIAVEWQFYLVFPLLLVFAHRSGVKILVSIVMVFLLMRGLAFLQGAHIRNLSYWTIVGRIDQFLIGMMAGMFYRRYFRQSPAFDGLFFVSSVAMLAALYVFNRLGGWPANTAIKIVWPTLEGGLWGGCILGYLSVARWVPASLSRLWAAVGVISYSIYLTHFIVIDLCIKYHLRLEIAGLAPIWNAVVTTAVVVLPIVIPLSMLTYYSIERPFLNLRGVYKRPLPVAEGDSVIPPVNSVDRG